MVVNGNSKKSASARWALRAATAADHQRLDTLVGDLDLADCRDLECFLQGNHAAYTALLPNDALCGGHIARRLDLLDADLGALGGGGACTQLPTLEVSPPSSMGLRYVIAGSALGGRMLARRHAASADPQTRAAGRFLGDPKLAAYWPSVLAELDAEQQEATSQREVQQTACACFGLFERAFSWALSLHGRVPERQHGER